MREHFKISNPYYSSVRDGSPGVVAKHTTNYGGVKNMTSNEVAYWQLQETKRSNLRNEGLKDDSNKETRRTNRANEGIKQDANSISRADLSNKALSAQASMKQAEAAQSQADTAKKRQLVDARRAEFQNVNESVRTGVDAVSSGLKAFSLFQ